jgi:hypothetical protein
VKQPVPKSERLQLVKKPLNVINAIIHSGKVNSILLMLWPISLPTTDKVCQLLYAIKNALAFSALFGILQPISVVKTHNILW